MPGSLFTATADGEVVLRTREREDNEFFHRNVNDPEVRRLLRNTRPKSLHAIDQEYEKYSGNDGDEEGYGFVICAAPRAAENASEEQDDPRASAAPDEPDAPGGAERDAPTSPAGDAGDADEEAVGETDGAPDTPVGSIGVWSVDHVNATAWMGAWIDPRYHGRGYAPRGTALAVEFAFDGLNLNRVRAGVYEPNRPSQRVMEKLGFVREGVHRQDQFVDGEFCDVYHYGMLREEWDGEEWL